MSVEAMYHRTNMPTVAGRDQINFTSYLRNLEGVKNHRFNRDELLSFKGSRLKIRDSCARNVADMHTGRMMTGV
jgi:hypothetical protein